MTLTQIINAELGHPDIFGHPHRLNVDAVPKTEHVAAAVVEGAGAGQSFEWVVDLSWDWWEDDD